MRLLRGLSKAPVRLRRVAGTKNDYYLCGGGTFVCINSPRRSKRLDMKNCKLPLRLACMPYKLEVSNGRIRILSHVSTFLRNWKNLVSWRGTANKFSVPNSFFRHRNGNRMKLFLIEVFTVRVKGEAGGQVRPSPTWFRNLEK